MLFATVDAKVAELTRGVDKSNQMNNFTEKLTVPVDAPKGEGIVSASLLSLYGAASSPTLINYNISVTFGDETSTDYKSATG